MRQDNTALITLAFFCFFGRAKNIGAWSSFRWIKCEYLQSIGSATKKTPVSLFQIADVTEFNNAVVPNNFMKFQDYQNNKKKSLNFWATAASLK